MIFFEFPSSWSYRTIIFRIKVNHKPEFLVVSMQDLVGYFQNNKHFITNLIKELFVWQLAHHSAYPCCMPHIPIAHCLSCSCSRRSWRDLSHHPMGCFVFSLMFTKRKSLPRPRPHTKLKLATKVSQFVVKSQRIAVNRKINARIFPNEFLFFCRRLFVVSFRHVQVRALSLSLCCCCCCCSGDCHTTDSLAGVAKKMRGTACLPAPTSGSGSPSSAHCDDAAALLSAGCAACCMTNPITNKCFGTKTTTATTNVNGHGPSWVA